MRSLGSSGSLVGRVVVLSQVRKLVCHGHAVKAVNVTPVTHHVVRVGKPVVDWLVLFGCLLLLQLLLHLLLLSQFVPKHLVVLCGILSDLVLGLRVQIVLYRVLLDEAMVSFRQLTALVYNRLYLLKVRRQLGGGFWLASPLARLFDNHLEDPVVDHCFLVVLVVLLAVDRVHLGRLHAKVVQQLQPEPLQTRGVGLEQFKVVANGRQDLVELLRCILVLHLDPGEHRLLNALVGLLVLDELVADKLAERSHPSFILLLQQLFFVLLLVSDEVVQHVLNQLFFARVLHQLPLDCVDDLSDSADEQVLQHLGAQRIGCVHVLALPVELLHHLDVQVLVHALFF